MAEQNKKNIKQRFSTKFVILCCLVVFLSTVTFKRINAAAVVTPLVTVQMVQGTYMCVLPTTFALGTTMLGTSILAGVASANTQLITTIQTEAALAETYINLAILNDTIKPISDFFTEIWLKMFHVYFRKMTSNFSVLEANQERMIGSLIDASEQNRTIRNLEKSEFEASRSLRPSESLQMVATVIGGLQRAKNVQQGYNLASAAALMERTAASELAVDPAGSGTVEDFSKGKDSDLDKRWDKYVNKYCAKDENAGNSGCTVDGTFVGKDINVTDTLFSRETIEVADQGMSDALNELVVNIVEPFIIDPLPPGLSDGSKGKEFILELESYKSKRQVVLDAVNHVVSRRLPGSKMGAYMSNLRADAGINTESMSSLAPYNPSYNEIMHYMTSERFRTGNFAVEQIDEPENNQRERVVQSAFFLMQLSDMADLLDKQAMLLSAQISNSVKDNTKVTNSGVGSKSTD